MADVSQQSRDMAAGKGHAMPDGSYPIRNVEDLKAAIQSFGRAKNPDMVKRHIIKRARALGRVDLLPDGWNVSGGGSSADKLASQMMGNKG